MPMLNGKCSKKGGESQTISVEQGTRCPPTCSRVIYVQEVVVPCIYGNGLGVGNENLTDVCVCVDVCMCACVCACLCTYQVQIL